MKLVPAGGSPQMRRALERPYVHFIVAIIAEHPELLTIVASILKTFDCHAQVGLTTALDNIRLNQSRPGDNGLTPPLYVSELIQILHSLYQQSDEEIRYQRGAILEVLLYMLVRSRYQSDECQSDYRFEDERGRYVTEQIDVAVLSQRKGWVEAYECKLKANGIESPHCTGLVYLVKVAEREGYQTNVGFVALEDERIILRRIGRLSSSTVLKAYGLNSIWLLRNSPF